MHRENKKRKIIIFSLVGILLLMAVGYSAFKTNLNITGTSNITSVWDVRITNVKIKETSGLAENVGDLDSYTNLEANMEANFYEPGDYITYTVTVSNKGTLDAMLDSVKLNMPEQEVINFKVEGATSKEKLPAGSSKDIDVTMEYTGNNPEDVGSVEADVNLDYVQDGRPTEFPDADSPEEDNLRIKDIILTPDETSVKAEIDAEGAIKYYYSIDNNTWYESTENIYNIYHLKPNTTYTMYVKAEGENGKVVYSSKPFTTLDNTSPKVNINIGDNVKGENGWYKGLSLNTEVTDNDKVKEVLYCVGQDCTPNKSLTLENNKATITLESNKNSQELCIKATDMVGNTTNKCSSEYKVDVEIPTLSNMNIETKDDVMEVTLEATDNESGLYKYYFSKDGGKTYIESDNPNYTFTGLDEGDYLVTAYVKDTAGNESEIKAQSTAIRYTSYCKKNNIDDFGDCLIATEAQNPNIAEAKATIEAKGTPNFTKTSPSILYSEIHDSNTSTMNDSVFWKVSTSYSFNSETGMYSLINPSFIDPKTLDFSNGKYYYRFLSPDVNMSSQDTLLKIVDLDITKDEVTSADIYKATVYRYNSKINSYNNSETGMYMSYDNSGNSYYYRGSVSSNYVKFAGFYWRVIRVNGDGTVRLIYDGTKPHANGDVSSDRIVGKSQYNVYNSDNGDVGYMYGDKSKNNIQESDYIMLRTDFSATTSYSFGSSYTYDFSTNNFKLSGTIVKATVTEYGNKYNDSHYYTCRLVNENNGCETLLKVDSYAGPQSLYVKNITNASTSYERAHKNINSSSIKKYVDNWYENNLINYTNKLSKGAYFCNNRKPFTVTSGNYTNKGYGLNPTIYAYGRFVGWNNTKKTPTLMCPEKNDTFTVSSEIGNNILTYPIALITADEAAMAGNSTGSRNQLSYLYVGDSYWTMTPGLYSEWGYALNHVVSPNGNDMSWREDVHGSRGVKPVINIDSSKITFSGNGTMQDPYVLS